MFFLDKSEIERHILILRERLNDEGIDENLRGYSWIYKSSEVRPDFNYNFGASEVALRYCETFRDIYLKRILKTRAPPSIKTFRGQALHQVFHDAILKVKDFIYKNFPLSGGKLIQRNFEEKIGIECDKIIMNVENKLGQNLDEIDKDKLKRECYILYRYLLIQAAARIDQVLSKFKNINKETLISYAIPSVTEKKIDGSIIGFSKELSVDLFLPFNAVADIKTGEVRYFHKHVLAAYALAIEACENIPINYGMVIYVKIDFEKEVPYFDVKYYFLSNEIRREVLSWRDESYNIIKSNKDPGKPQVCPEYCPYFIVCNAEKVTKEIEEKIFEK